MHAAQSLMDERLRAVADPTRRDILRLVASNEKPAGDIAQQFSITRPAVSRHLRVLRDAQLVTVRDAGTSRFYRADIVALKSMGAWFDSFWEDGLPRLKALAEAEEAQKADPQA